MDDSVLLENTDKDMQALPDGAPKCDSAAQFGDKESLADETGLIKSSPDIINIADEVITQIVILAAGRVEGIALSNAGVSDGIAGFLGMKNQSKGIKIDSDGKSVSVDISISVEYGRRVGEAAKKLQDEIRGDLTNMTGLEVAQVAVHVLSLNIKDQPAAKQSKASKQQKQDCSAAGPQNTEQAPEAVRDSDLTVSPDHDPEPPNMTLPEPETQDIKNLDQGLPNITSQVIEN